MDLGPGAMVRAGAISAVIRRDPSIMTNPRQNVWLLVNAVGKGKSGAGVLRRFSRRCWEVGETLLDCRSLRGSGLVGKSQSQSASAQQ